MLLLLFYCEMAQRIPATTHSHLFAAVLALIIHATAWWHRTQFALQMERIGQQALKQVQVDTVEWKQSINFFKSKWQWAQRRVFIPIISVSLDRPTSHPENSRVQMPCVSRK